jgi:acetyltransferase-like isoleucine patch superfamily enzyme
MQAWSDVIAATAIIHPNVILGDNCIVEDFCVIGVPFAGYAGEKTVIGNNAVIRTHTVIYAGNTIGDNFMTGHKANIRELNTIGDNVSIGTLSVVEHHVTIGKGVRIHTQVFVPEYTILEDECWLGPNVVVTNDRFPQSPKEKKKLLGVTVKSRAKVGANSTLCPGIVIASNTLIGAGSVVTKNTLSGKIYAGNPARVLRDIDY